MKQSLTPITDCLEVEYDRFGDSRGYFQELFSTNNYEIPPGQQISCSWSQTNVIRGIHISPYYKLCTCVKGRIFDVCVDLRPNSPTFLKWYGTWLSEENQKQMLVPGGCGHGFYAAEDSLFVYLQGGTFESKLDALLKWDDPDVGIVWPPGEYIISEKDKNAPNLRQIDRFRPFLQ